MVYICIFWYAYGSASCAVPGSNTQIFPAIQRALVQRGQAPRTWWEAVEKSMDFAVKDEGCWIPESEKLTCNLLWVYPASMSLTHFDHPRYEELPRHVMFRSLQRLEITGSSSSGTPGAMAAMADTWCLRLFAWQNCFFTFTRTLNLPG